MAFCKAAVVGDLGDNGELGRLVRDCERNLHCLFNREYQATPQFDGHFQMATILLS
jgi:hypothetical protein